MAVCRADGILNRHFINARPLAAANRNNMTVEVQRRLIISITVFLLSFVVIGDFHLDYILSPFVWILPIYVIYPWLTKHTTELWKDTLPYVIIISLSAIVYFGCRHILCGYGTASDWYVSTKNKNLKLVGRDFSCFGTTGDLVLYKQYQILPGFKLECHYKTFEDYKVNLDSATWEKIRIP